MLRADGNAETAWTRLPFGQVWGIRLLVSNDLFLDTIRDVPTRS